MKPESATRSLRMPESDQVAKATKIQSSKISGRTSTKRKWRAKAAPHTNQLAHTAPLRRSRPEEAGVSIVRSDRIDEDASSMINNGLIAARAAVFSTTELLESILIHVEPKRVMVGQRVCTLFQDTILSSPQLQEALCFRLRASGTTLRWVSVTTGLYDKSPRLYQNCDREVPVPSEENKTVRSITPVKPNMVMRVVTGGFESKLSSNVRIARYLHEEAAPAAYVELRKKESWHRMYICSPAPTKTRIDLRWIIKTGVGGSVVREVQDPNGVTFAALFDAAFNQRSNGADARGHWTDMGVKGDYVRFTLNQVLDRLGKKHGKKARLVPSTPCIIKLYDMVAPTQAEWDAIEDDLE
nr:hypothetical protein CFP56_21689 [Quercus suber]